MIWRAWVGILVIGLFAALPFTFQPPMPRHIALRLATRYVLSLAVGVAVFEFLHLWTSWRIAWAVAITFSAGLMVAVYGVWAHRERSSMWAGVAVTLAASCAWFVALVSRGDTPGAHAAKIAILSGSAALGAFGIVKVTKAAAPWARRRS